MENTAVPMSDLLKLHIRYGLEFKEKNGLLDEVLFVRYAELHVAFHLDRRVGEEEDVAAALGEVLVFAVVAPETEFDSVKGTHAHVLGARAFGDNALLVATGRELSLAQWAGGSVATTGLVIMV